MKAIQLAKEDLEDTNYQYELVIEIISPDKAEPAIEKLLKIDQVDALVVGLSISGQIEGLGVAVDTASRSLFTSLQGDVLQVILC